MLTGDHHTRISRDARESHIAQPIYVDLIKHSVITYIISALSLFAELNTEAQFSSRNAGKGAFLPLDEAVASFVICNTNKFQIFTVSID